MRQKTTSLRAAECIQGTEAFPAGSRSLDAVAIASRKALASMYEIMAETVKEDKREWFRRGVAICIIIETGALIEYVVSDAPWPRATLARPRRSPTLACPRPRCPMLACPHPAFRC